MEPEGPLSLWTAPTEMRVWLAAQRLLGITSKHREGLEEPEAQTRQPQVGRELPPAIWARVARVVMEVTARV